ncbi:MAG: imidazole glycerol-phosphate synthase subunit HisH [Actinomycetota bacterium]|jgi:glutamine amidotransferase
MNTVAIVDYGMGNLDSVRRAVEECGGRAIVSGDAADIEAADRIILPGVGAFPSGMQNLQSLELDKVLEDQVRGEAAPFLGICLGMQLLASVGLEGGHTAGLNWIEGEVKRFEATETDVRIPHVGWNEVAPVRDSPLLAGIEANSDFYFVHSYHFACQADDDVVATTPYCGNFPSVVARGNVHAVQFHPEKSQRVGLRLLANFLSI